jgi:hypothetical protein
MASVKLGTLLIRVRHLASFWSSSAPEFMRDCSQTHKQPNQDASQTVRVAISSCVAGLMLDDFRHETFRKVCVGLAQTMYRGEAKLRTTLLGEPVKSLRPLSETK